MRESMFPPPTLQWALGRIETIERELRRIDLHLNDEKRINNYPSVDSYFAWKDSARRADGRLRFELWQLKVWVTAHKEKLFRKLTKLFDTLIEEEVDFDDTELALIQEARSIVHHEDQKQKETIS